MDEYKDIVKNISCELQKVFAIEDPYNGKKYSEKWLECENYADDPRGKEPHHFRIGDGQIEEILSAISDLRFQLTTKELQHIKRYNGIPKKSTFYNCLYYLFISKQQQGKKRKEIDEEIDKKISGDVEKEMKEWLKENEKNYGENEEFKFEWAEGEQRCVLYNSKSEKRFEELLETVQIDKNLFYAMRLTVDGSTDERLHAAVLFFAYTEDDHIEIFINDSSKNKYPKKDTPTEEVAKKLQKYFIDNKKATKVTINTGSLFSQRSTFECPISSFSTLLLAKEIFLKERKKDEGNVAKNTINRIIDLSQQTTVQQLYSFNSINKFVKVNVLKPNKLSIGPV